MAHIKKKELADGRVRYEVRHRDSGGKERSQTFKTSAAAKAFKVEVESSKYQGGFVDRRAGLISVGQFSKDVLESKTNLTEKSYWGYERLLRLHINPHLGATRLNELSEHDVVLWNAYLKKERAKSVAPKAYSLLRALLNTAVLRRLISASPCKIEKGGFEDHAKPIVLTAEEVFELAAAMKPRYSGAVLVKTFGALRTGELLGLRRSDFNFETGVLNIQRQLDEPKGGGFSFSYPKWNSRGKIALPQFLLERLVKHNELFAQPGVDGLIFPGDRGGPTRKGVWEEQFVKAKMAAGFPDITPHGLRHSGLSLAGAAGGSIAELQQFARHKTARAAMMYQHPFEDSSRKVAGRFDHMVGDALTQKEEDSE